jgi:hypothetical protein
LIVKDLSSFKSSSLLLAVKVQLNRIQREAGDARGIPEDTEEFLVDADGFRREEKANL